MSFQYLTGAEIDYKEDIEGAQFVIRNPNAVTTCGLIDRHPDPKGRIRVLSPFLGETALPVPRIIQESPHE